MPRVGAWRWAAARTSRVLKGRPLVSNTRRIARRWRVSRSISAVPPLWPRPGRWRSWPSRLPPPRRRRPRPRTRSASSAPREPHVAGTPGDQRLVEALARAHRDLSLEVETQELWLYLPRPVRAELEVIAPVRRRLPLREDVLREDPWRVHPDLDAGWNAWSGSGEARGRVVYANYGTKDDFARLAALGVGVKGQIVLARYGGNFRGMKARFAEEAGAAGLVLFTDPADGGSAEGPKYPEVGFSHPSAIQ